MAKAVEKFDGSVHILSPRIPQESRNTTLQIPGLQRVFGSCSPPCAFAFNRVFCTLRKMRKTKPFPCRQITTGLATFSFTFACSGC